MYKRLSLIGVLLVILALACSDGAAITPSASSAAADNVGTIVAGTMTAMAASGVTPSVNESPPGSLPAGAGLRVAYVKDGDIWLWVEGSGALRLTGAKSDSDVRISDDGQVVAFRRNNEMWAVNADGSGARPLVGLAYLGSLMPAGGGQVLVNTFEFLPGSRIVFFNTGVQGEAFFAPQFDLHRVDADNPTPLALLQPGAGGAFYFAPNRARLAVVQPEKINVVNVDGTGWQTVFGFTQVSTYSEWFYLPEVVWMPDSSGLKAVIPPPDPLGNPAATTRFMYISADGSMTAQLAAFLAAPVFVSPPHLSPDGDRIAYLRENGANLELHVVDSSTTDELYTSYAKEAIGLVGWAPDPVSFVFWMDNPQALQLGRLGGSPVPLTDAPQASAPRWISADRFLFFSNNELRLRRLDAPSNLIDSGILPAYQSCDFAD